MKPNDYDTIFASSSQFRSAIKIIRISGKKAKKIANIFNFKLPKPRTFTLRKLIYRKNIVDQAPVIWLPRKQSFTGEDTYEIYIHGSIAIEKKIYIQIFIINKLYIPHKVKPGCTFYQMKGMNSTKV